MNPGQARNIPVHVAIIMDGNGRWAKKRHLPRIFGHRAGIESVRAIVKASRDIGVKYLSIFVFSTENWNRPKTEVNAIMGLLKRYLRKEVEELKRNEVRVAISGDFSGLPQGVQNEITYACRKTSFCDKMVFNLCLNYGSRNEIVRAVNSLLNSGKKAITEKDISNALYSPEIPDPDLLIRTSGEHRLSNFMLWQAAYTELYFTPVLWPDFDRKHYFEAIENYGSRERRFGGI